MPYGRKSYVTKKSAKDAGIAQKHLISMAPKGFWMPTLKLLQVSIFDRQPGNKLLLA
jgi:hypothetical protein